MITKINIPKEYENRFLKENCFEFSSTHTDLTYYGEVMG